ncbi:MULTISPECIES: hypothetical protein [Thermoanaerobacter]|uniref:Uncharacterized protein n=1 Tax=Thermoanaerobacter brockii subsp. finnii (strain ATCC 43586 / DSM 3389 / AKO-1) TaxID=509193 RepID=E8UV93_THEBF|nr:MULTISPECIES: hypothetical protein [Thermoanaerobacter]ADV79036.1 hypothetical protein Thebr_0421 [Thermoanaerobacter brockii subsp. finnii Ako-1]
MIKKLKALLTLVIGIILFTYMAVVIPFENPPVWVICLSCELLPLCGGGCPGLIFDRYGTLQEVDPRCCRRKNNETPNNRQKCQ